MDSSTNKLVRRFTVEEAQEIADKGIFAKCMMNVNIKGWSEDMAQQLADCMRELKETDNALQSSADWSAQLSEDNDRLMRENKELRQCLEGFYFDTMYKDSPGLHDIACKLLAPYNEEFAAVHRSKHSDV